MTANNFARKAQAFKRVKAAKPAYIHRPALMTLTQALFSGLPFREFRTVSAGAYVYKNGNLYFSDYIPMLFCEKLDNIKPVTNIFSANDIIGGIYYNIFEDELKNLHFRQTDGLHLMIDEREADIAVNKFRTEMAYAQQLGRRK